MIKFYVKITDTAQWYKVMSQCREWFGTNWQTMPRTRKKLRHTGTDEGIWTWFLVPDEKFVAWLALKTSLPISLDPGKN
jgi:hypothetical protein